MIFHPASTQHNNQPSSSPIPSPPSVVPVQEHQIKMQIIYCVVAHTLVNRRYASAISIAIRHERVICFTSIFTRRVLANNFVFQLAYMDDFCPLSSASATAAYTKVCCRCRVDHGP
jgi:hypothetical protein